MRDTPAKLIETTWKMVSGNDNHFPGGRPRGISGEKTGEGLERQGETFPQIVYQYDGGTITSALGSIRETERAISYTVWDDGDEEEHGIHKADIWEKKFLEALCKSRRVTEMNSSFSFIDSSTGRPAAHTSRAPSEIGGIQREVLIRS